MALIKCKECNKDISSEANSCPHCGYVLKPTVVKKKKKYGCFTLVIGTIIVLMVIGALSEYFSDKSSSDKSISHNTKIPEEAINKAHERAEQRMKGAKTETKKAPVEFKSTLEHKVLACYKEKDAKAVWLAVEAADISFAKDALLNESCLWIDKGTPYNGLEVKDKTAKAEFWINDQTYLILYIVLQEGLVQK